MVAQRIACRRQPEYLDYGRDLSPIRTATDLALDVLDRLQAFTPTAEALALPRKSLADVFAELRAHDGGWSRQAVFRDALDRLAPVVEASERPVVYTDYLHFFPNFLRIKDGKITEIVSPFGHLGDPLLGLAMVWIYDCYPFVHTGFVEQYLVRHDVPRREFGVRLAVQTMRIMVRELHVERPKEPGYWESLMGLLARGLSWIQ